MTYIPKESDFDLLYQPDVILNIKAEILNSNGTVLNVLNGLISGGSFNIDSISDVRRTASITLVPTDEQSTNIAEDSLLWINKDIHLYIGIQDVITGEIVWFSQGYYVFTNTSNAYNATTNELTISCSDWTVKLDGSKNGTMGQLTTIIPAYEEDENGNPIKYNIIKDALKQIASQLVGLTSDKIMIEDIGEYMAMPQYNNDWEVYRKNNPLWNTVPYDLEFSCGNTLLDMITTIRDLYPNYETFFDTNNVFTCQMIPSCDSDPVLLRNDVLQDLMISEDLSLDLTEVKNVCEIWGQVFETDYYTESANLSGSCYTLSIDHYDAYANGDIVSFLCPASRTGTTTIKINSLDAITLYDENTDGIYKEKLEAGTCYTLKIKRNYVNGAYVVKAYMQGTYQVHAMSVLSNGTCKENVVTPEGHTVVKYSKQYFQEMYNCKNVNIQIIKDSPFAVEKVGELLFVGEGDEYENITSDSLCLARCDYELYKHARLTDSIGIEMLICPFLDVNIKAAYQRSDSNEENEYIVQKVSHNFDSFTTSLTLTRFYELYESA